MSIIKSKNIIERIDFLVRMKRTGGAGELADLIGISRRSAFYYLNELRDLGAPLSWSHQDNSYVYLESGNIEIRFISK